MWCILGGGVWTILARVWGRNSNKGLEIVGIENHEVLVGNVKNIDQPLLLTQIIYSGTSVRDIMMLMFATVLRSWSDAGVSFTVDETINGTTSGSQVSGVVICTGLDLASQMEKESDKVIDLDDYGRCADPPPMRCGCIKYQSGCGILSRLYQNEIVLIHLVGDGVEYST